MEDEKVRENRVRRIAARRGYVLRKSRRRDSKATDYGRWYVLEARRNLHLEEFDSLDALEAWLDS